MKRAIVGFDRLNLGTPFSRAVRAGALILWAILALAGAEMARAADVAALQREYLDLFQAYHAAVKTNADPAETARMAASLKKAQAAFEAATGRTGPAIDDGPDSPAVNGQADGSFSGALTGPDPQAPLRRQAADPEEAAYDALIARLYQPDRDTAAGPLLVAVKEFATTARNPFFRMQATFEWAALAFETTHDAGVAETILQTYARTAPTPEARRLALARIPVFRMEAAMGRQRQAFAKASRAAGMAWQSYSGTSWLAFPSKLARLAGYFRANHVRRQEAAGLRQMLDRYDELVQETYPKRSLDQLTSSRLIPGNSLRLLVNGRTSFRVRYALAEQARERIWIQTLLYYNDETGNKLADILIRKAGEGLDVRVVADDAFSFSRKSSIFRKLENGGVKVLINNPLLRHPFKANFRSHQKMFLIDDEAAVVGGMNIANDYAYGEIEPWGWRDTDVEVRGPVVAEIADLYEENWDKLETDRLWAKVQSKPKPPAEKKEKTPLLPHRDQLLPGPLPHYFEEPPAFENVRVRFVKTFPITEKDDNVLDLFVAYMKAAKREVIFETAYFIPTPILRDAIIATCKRGVKVKILTNSLESNNHPNAGYAGRSNYAAVMAAGAEIYEWRGGQTLHSKVSWFDGFAVTVGAYNVNSRSHALDSEDILAIEDRRVAATMKKALDLDFSRARRVTAADLEAWRGDFSERVKMDFYSLFSWIF